MPTTDLQNFHGTSRAGELFGTFAHLNSLDEIAATVATCKRCPLYATALNPVPGTGNPNAVIGAYESQLQGAR